MNALQIKEIAEEALHGCIGTTYASNECRACKDWSTSQNKCTLKENSLRKIIELLEENECRACKDWSTSQNKCTLKENSLRKIIELLEENECTS